MTHETTIFLAAIQYQVPTALKLHQLIKTIRQRQAKHNAYSLSWILVI